MACYPSASEHQSVGLIIGTNAFFYCLNQDAERAN